jgi:hypothetical protein
MTTVEQKIVRAADLAGLADEYSQFAAKAADLKREHEFLHGVILTDAEWKEMVKRNIEVYLKDHIYLTTQYFNEHGESDWHTRVMANLTQFLAN